MIVEAHHPPWRRVAKTPPGYENAFGTMHRLRRGLSSSFLSAHQAVRTKGGRGRYLRDGSGKSRSKGGGSTPTGTGRHREGNNEACNERMPEHRRLRNGHITVTIFLCKYIRHEGFPPFSFLFSFFSTSSSSYPNMANIVKSPFNATSKPIPPINHRYLPPIPPLLLPPPLPRPPSKANSASTRAPSKGGKGIKLRRATEKDTSRAAAVHWRRKGGRARARGGGRRARSHGDGCRSVRREGGRKGGRKGERGPS